MAVISLNQLVKTEVIKYFCTHQFIKLELLTFCKANNAIKMKTMVVNTKAVRESYLDTEFFMKKSYALYLLISIFLLIISEYFFLQEIFGRKQLFILSLSILGLSFNILFISYIFRQYKKNF
jgi:hypothetical protein